MHGPMLDRRGFLRRAGVIGTALPLLRSGHVLAAPEAALAARRVYFEDPDYGNVRISHDGAQLAWLAPIDGVRNLWIAPTDRPSAGRPVTRVTERSLGNGFIWAHNNRQLVFFEDHDGDENWRGSSVDIATGAVVKLSPERGVLAFVQHTDRQFPDEILLRHNQRDKRFFDLYRVNLVTGASTLIYENHEYVGLITDKNFRLRLGNRFVADGSTKVFEHQADGGWVEFMTIPIGDLDSTWIYGFSADDDTLYMLDTRGRDKAALVAIDMATRRSTVLVEDDEADIVGVAFAPLTHRPLAARSIKDRTRWHAVTAEAKADLARLAAYGPGDFEFVSRSADNRQATVLFVRDTASAEYALLDRPSGRVTSLFKARPEIDRLALRPLESVVIPARDGLTLNAYLTLPDRPSSGPSPLVLAIHGGPYARDNWGFSGIHQWLANRGYAVLSVNYRCSTGFGKAFVTAADREWGGRMHDDLIDAVDWAVGRGVADPKLVGFYGASYGGYSALMAATKTPERFACIVDVFGISNLQTFMATIPPYWGPWFSIWKNRLADPGTEAGRAFLRERSPLTYIERASKPILIAQGMQDVRVVPAESEQMVAALKNRGVPVTYVSFRDEGHGFVRSANRLAFFAVVEAFLAKHLGGRYQPIGDDFAGSTLKVETGGELVPGLTG